MMTSEMRIKSDHIKNPTDSGIINIPIIGINSDRTPNMALSTKRMINNISNKTLTNAAVQIKIPFARNINDMGSIYTYKNN